MRTPLVHGCYDASTLRTLKEIGIRNFGFDLRGRSPNLVPFYELKEFFKLLSSERVQLIFENDKTTTIRSFLDLLSDVPMNLHLEFRDKQDSSFYDSFGVPYAWMFSLEADWKSILSSKHIRTVLLPLGYQAFYQTNTTLWELIDKNNIEVYLHVLDLHEAHELQGDPEVQISLDLGREFEQGFRSMNQALLKKEIQEIF